MPRAQSAAVVLYRRRRGPLEVFLVHPGGPFWQRKDEGAWSFPKGEFTAGERAQDAARREFTEETGFELAGELRPLTPIKQRSGKIVHPFAIEGDCDADRVRSNTFELEWPPKSGVRRAFPEVDRAGWFDIETAQRKLVDAQRPVLGELEAIARERA
jgi:predicted NUDIX family NTP pyrophosphohydrolase